MRHGVRNVVFASRLLLIIRNKILQWFQIFLFLYPHRIGFLKLRYNDFLNSPWKTKFEHQGKKKLKRRKKKIETQEKKIRTQEKIIQTPKNKIKKLEKIIIAQIMMLALRSSVNKILGAIIIFSSFLILFFGVWIIFSCVRIFFPAFQFFFSCVSIFFSLMFKFCFPLFLQPRKWRLIPQHVPRPWNNWWIQGRNRVTKCKKPHTNLAHELLEPKMFCEWIHFWK